MKKIGVIIVSLFLVLMGCNSSQESTTEEAQEEIRSEQNTPNYQDIGFKYAMTVKGILGKNLMGAIQKEGAENAVSMCNTRAMVLVDSVAWSLNASIKRVSDKFRNPNNAANELELNYINKSKEVLARGKKIKPKAQELDNKIVCFYPILTNAMCMQCHGEPNTQIKEATLDKIDELYPNDLARGYAENQLRGIWVVEMDKE